MVATKQKRLHKCSCRIVHFCQAHLPQLSQPFGMRGNTVGGSSSIRGSIPAALQL